MTKNEGDEAKNNFNAKLKMIDAEKKYNLKYLEYQNALQGTITKGRFKDYNDNSDDTNKVIEAINEKKNRLNNKIAEIGEKQGLWNEWLVDLKGTLKK